MRKWTKTLLVQAGLMALLVVSGRAELFGTIADIGSGSITIGDKVFSGFSVLGVDPSLVNVSGTQTGSEVDIVFGGPFVASVATDFQLYYDVLSLGPKIISIDQSFNLSVGGTGGTVLIGETVFDGPGVGATRVAQSSVGFVVGGPDPVDPPGEAVQGDLLILEPKPLQHVWVTKDIFVVPNTGGVVGASIIRQSFHQQSVPDGGVTLMLLGGALVGLETLRRRLRV